MAFHLSKDGDGRPIVTMIKRVIKNPLAKYYEEYSWSWPQDIVDTSVSEDDEDNSNNGGRKRSSSNEEDKESYNNDEIPN